jgi:hypothetical protein
MAPGTWVSATELADYAYCPRSHYYAAHPPPGGPAPAAQRSARAGARYHARELGRERHREEGGAAAWAAIAAGIALTLGGGLWLFLR